ncbi:MAG: sigma-70 family RNA polymerase sigma factor [Candidatus Eremiobacteraeota bacterium]|nr:sigma-70 family RNA polymerase sigma factor [Candidatus Eremiobacteraeota bacterium]MBV9264143.1 sigma-70 family RNA polymerase sigma factor [Candidatus Eremiobacteraeota bacterium]
MSVQTDSAAFTQALHRHAAILHKVARAYCPSPANRPDLIQEMTIALWKSYSRYDPSRTFSSWMYRIALNVAISRFRREGRHDWRFSELDEAADVADGRPEDPRVTMLLECVDRLDPLDKALMLLQLDGYSHEEIADTVGITATNTATKLSRIRARLRIMMGEKTDGTR